MSARAQCIVFANHKGGVGKTTSCLSVAACLAKAGQRVLVVDFEPQSDATSGLGIDSKTLRQSMYDVVLGSCDEGESVPIRKVIVETAVENLHETTFLWRRNDEQPRDRNGRTTGLPA